MNLRDRNEKLLEKSIEGNFRLPVVLIDPDGVVYDHTVDGRPLCGLVLYDSKLLNPETGEGMMVPYERVTMRRSSLARLPLSGEKWIVKIPSHPTPDSPLVAYAITPTRPISHGRSIGYITLYLTQLEAK